MSGVQEVSQAFQTCLGNQSRSIWAEVVSGKLGALLGFHDWEAPAADLRSAIDKHMPEVLDGITCGRRYSKRTAGQILQAGVEEVWRRYKPGTGFALDSVCERMAHEFRVLLEEPTLAARLRCHISGLHIRKGENHVLVGKRSWTVRQLNSEDDQALGPRLGPWAHEDACVETFFKVPVRFGPYGEGSTPALDCMDVVSESVAVLQSIQLATCGRMNDSRLLVEPVSFCPIVLTFQTSRDPMLMEHCFLDSEAAKLAERILEFLFKDAHAATRLACDRFRMACERTRDEDQVIDASIGMEAVLLAKANQELSYRFALRYASLFGDPMERWRAYKRARAFYAIRSRIAHGENPEDKDLKACSETGDLRGVALAGRLMLRDIILRLMADPDRPRFEIKDSWERTLLGLDPGDAEE